MINNNHPYYYITVCYRKQEDGSYLVDVTTPDGVFKGLTPQFAERAVKLAKAKAQYHGRDVLVVDESAPEQLNG